MKTKNLLTTAPEAERAILVGAPPLDELRELTTSTGAQVVSLFHVVVGRPHPAHFIGKGKAEELRLRVEQERAGVVVFDDELSPAQGRNLEEILECKVVDRTGVILDIFASRARTREGQLQVEHAQLNYRLTRLAGSSSYLSRLGGGIGTRGPGETRLEMDRRRIRSRIATLKNEIDELRKHRQLHRERRRRDNAQMVSLVGYTNAGKSTLFRALTREDTLVSSRVFSTLDTLVRRIPLARDRHLLVADTVGFIRKLPHQLVSAFRATLEEVVEADLLLLVLDASDPDLGEKQATVLSVLEEIGADRRPVLNVYNKIDLLEPEAAERIRRIAAESDAAVISASTGEGVQELVDMCLERLRKRESE